MRLPLIIASVVCSLVLPGAAQAAGSQGKKISSKKMGLTIRVEGSGWGSAEKEEIESVLYSVADELMTRVPKKMSVPIVVTHTDRNPVALYDRSADGEYQVHLHAKDRRWSLFAYEFAHELCHIMSNYEENVGADTTKYNQWFEETLCEAASLYTLRSMAARWKVAAPYPQWNDYAPALGEFADRLISEGHRRLPSGTPLAAWLRDNEDRLRNDPYQREKNEVVANLLLPLFEQNPENWGALNYMNLNPADARDSLSQYLQHWYENAPPAHKGFIRDVLALLGVHADSPMLAGQDAVTTPPVSSPADGASGGQAGPVH